MGVDLMTYRVRVGRFSNRGTFRAKDDAVSTHLSANKAFICASLLLATFAAHQGFGVMLFILVRFGVLQGFGTMLFTLVRYVALPGINVTLFPFVGFATLLHFGVVNCIMVIHAALLDFGVVNCIIVIHAALFASDAVSSTFVKFAALLHFGAVFIIKARYDAMQVSDPALSTLLGFATMLHFGVVICYMVIDAALQGYYRRRMHRLIRFDDMWPDKDTQLLIGGIELNPGPNTNQGYKVNFKEPDAELPPHLLCVKCNLLLRKPRQTVCGHRLCSGCLEEHISGGPQNCVVQDCKERISEDQVYPDRAVEREVLRLEVVCTNKGDGCPWEGILKDYEAHEAECEFIRQPCGRSGCKDFVYRKDLERHLKEDCVMRPVDCEYCNAQLVFKDIQDHHLSDCPEFPVECDQCHISKIFTRLQLKNHQDLDRGDCPVKLVKCSFASFGCTKKVKPEEIGTHLKDNLSEHVDLLFRKMDEVRRQQAEANAQHQNGEADRQCSELGSQLQAMRDTLTALDRQIIRSEQDQGPRPTPGQSREVNEVRGMMDERERKLQRCEEAIIDLARKLEVLFQQIDFYERERQKNQELMQAAANKITMLERSLASKDDTLQLNDTRVENLERATYNGILVWKITDFLRRRQDAVNNRVPSFYSPPFYTSKSGYKMCARIYLNGDGMGKGTHVSLFFVICKGSNDALLRWPFRQKVTLMLLDQNNKEHIIDAFRPDPSSSSFKKPTNEMNIASGCPMFATLSQLDSPSHAYIKDDTVFFKIIVDCADLQ